MTLKLYNTLTRQLEEFKPMDAQNVRMYACGITPYDWSHIGHARSAVAFDVLFRLLKHLYGKEHVTFVRNFTDIDDKIIARANETGEEPTALAERFIQAYKEDLKALNVEELPEKNQPRVSQYIPQIVKMVDDLIAIGAAYTTPSGDVMYRVSQFPKFGQLARRNIEQQIHGARVQVDAEKEAAEDFVLWKANEKSATKLAQAFNPVDYGAKRFTALGRPGWHIECSVMSESLLFNPAKNGSDAALFDIHGGGEDLQFPHHCCEIAQSEALHPNKQMANYWVHNAFITVNGKKMSKSLGNFTTIRDALQEDTGNAIRLWLLQTHYRKPVDYSVAALKAATNRLKNYAQALKPLLKMSASEVLKGKKEYVAYKPTEALVGVLLKDLDTPKFLAGIDEMINKSSSLPWSEDYALVSEIAGNLQFIGIDLYELPKFTVNDLMLSAAQSELVEQRTAARAAKDWKESDRLRDELLKQGIIVEDGPNGTTWRRA
jgi:cysteinyl-tRNA synthetase